MDSIFDATPAVLEWMDRIEALGRGASKIQRGRRDHRGGRAEPMPLLDDIFRTSTALHWAARCKLLPRASAPK